MDARNPGFGGFVKASTIFKQEGSQAKKSPPSQDIEAITEALATLMLADAGLEVVTVEDSPRPEREQGKSEL